MAAESFELRDYSPSTCVESVIINISHGCTREIWDASDYDDTIRSACIEAHQIPPTETGNGEIYLVTVAL